jgi:hypothetical protein
MINLKRLDSKLNWLPWAAIALIGLAVFPYGWLAERWWLFGWVTNFVFGTELAHIVGHLILYAAVGTAVLHTFPRLGCQPRLYLTLIMTLGLAQEILQLASFKKRPFGGDEFLDIAVDLLGAFIAFYWLTRDWRLKSND